MTLFHNDQNEDESWANNGPTAEEKDLKNEVAAENKENKMEKKTIEKLDKSKAALEQLKAQTAELTAKIDSLNAQAALEAQDDALKAGVRFFKSLYKGDLSNDFDELVEACHAMRDADPLLKCYAELPDDEFTQFIRRTVFTSCLEGFDMVRVIQNIGKTAVKELAEKHLG